MLLLVFAIRAAVPAGFMPDMHSASGDWITICSGVDVKTIHVDENGQPIEELSSDAVCPFSFLSAAQFIADYSFGDTVWYRAEFPVFYLSENSVQPDALYWVGHSIPKQAPPSFS